MKANRLLLITGLLLGFAIRLYQLGADSLWYDETVSAYLSSQPITQMIAHTAGDIHPPGYYFLLHLWHIITQPTIEHGLEFLLAWPSLWWGLLILPLLYKIGCILFTPRIALTALWLAAINPFHIWYSQEVRMYTLGAMLGLICFYALLKIVTPSPSTSSGKARQCAQIPYYFAYILSTALGLYTLYYFIFLWIALNLIALWIFVDHKRKNWTRINADKRGFQPSAFSPQPSHWLLAQCAIILLWFPWLPTFWQQATNPPRPPWRNPWQTFPQFMNSLTETLSTLLIGQSNFLEQNWPYALLTIVALTINYQLSTINCQLSTIHYTLLPIILIYLTTWLITPLYHVRYIFIYAPPFMLLLAVVIIHLWNRRQIYGIFAALLIAILNSLSLHTYWTDLVNKSDDHHAAVAELARAWRSGDLILVNAGWVYTALESYWPTELVGADGVLYPGLSEPKRLLDICSTADCLSADNPFYVRTGSVDGSTNLGWGNPTSDFFAISQTETEEALRQLANTYTRIWHYRLYDTVNDPDGVIRAWLDQHMTLQKEIVYSGRDFLQVQLYITDAPQPIPVEANRDKVNFGQALHLQAHQFTSPLHAGEPLYLTLWWEPLSELQSLSTDLAMSLRLYDGETLLAQSDESPLLPTGQWPANQQQVQQLMLPIPVSIKPGNYSLELVVYRQDDGLPLSLPESKRAIYGQRWQLDHIALQSPQFAPEITSVLAQFDYIDLVSAEADLINSETLGVNLVWRPRANTYQDTYLAVLELRNSSDAVLQSWSGLAGGDDYSSGVWLAEMPVGERRVLALDEPLSTGEYSLILKLERASDGLVIPARRGWWPLQQNDVLISHLRDN